MDLQLQYKELGNVMIKINSDPSYFSDIDNAIRHIVILWFSCLRQLQAQIQYKNSLLLPIGQSHHALSERHTDLTNHSEV